MSPVLTQHVSQPITLDEQTQKMKRHLLQDIRRSAYVYRVDCGGCNACEIEIFAAITPVFDAERFGIKVVSSPRHADILKPCKVSGAGAGSRYFCRRAKAQREPR